MGLTINTATNLLKQIVGRGSGNASYLALSSTEPYPNGDAPGNKGYNITEPDSTTSYARVSIGSYFPDTVDVNPTESPLHDGYTVSIKNNNEIHFPEALQNWGTYRWFAIYDAGENVKYVGELLKFVPDTNVVDQASYEAAVATGLYLFDSTANDYILIDLVTYPNYDSTKTYYIKDNSGITIEEGTVPLVRKYYLKISVQ